MLSDIFYVWTLGEAPGRTWFIARGQSLARRRVTATGCTHRDACIKYAGYGRGQSALQVPTRKSCWLVANGKTVISSGAGERFAGRLFGGNRDLEYRRGCRHRALQLPGARQGEVEQAASSLEPVTRELNALGGAAHDESADEATEHV